MGRNFKRPLWKKRIAPKILPALTIRPGVMASRVAKAAEFKGQP